MVYALSPARRPGTAPGGGGGRVRRKCGACRRQFSVTKSTILEGSRLPLPVWVTAACFLATGGEPTLAGLERGLGIGRTAARNLVARITYAALRPPLGPLLPPAESAARRLALARLPAEILLAALLATPAPTDPPAIRSATAGY